ncbi:hypothetical protein CQA53_11395 [Helicobacter didelphidarum]|uniref:Uncharacterized protein n=1 Tax=Helicobacter didelphidarum TaxID=2040648 RepID=A0A3D8I390_9HELI|nr:hypothetical protein [Helicobacter didelphidarum]RDU59578.1 hypothetical protein CQA53_11395 [Helicobacter didelphidarum]
MKIPKVYDKAYKEYEYKDYGVGRYTQLLEYSKDIQDDREYVGGGETSLQSMFITYNKKLINHNIKSHLLESKKVA